MLDDLALKKSPKNPLTASEVMLIFSRMKSLISSLAIVFAAGLSASAQTVATDPVGFVSYTVNARSDQKLGVPMQAPSVFQGTATTVSGTSVSAAGITALSGANYLLVTSGSAEGKWEQIASSSSNSVTLSAPISGFANGNSFVIKPFWTLGSLLPNGGGIPASPDVTDPVAVVYLNNPVAVGVNIPPTRPFAYSDGTGDFDAGWWDVNNPTAPVNTTVIEPDVFVTIRNNTFSPANITFAGSVPVTNFSLDVVSRAAGPQDNQLYNRWPANTTLGASGLAQSGAVLSTDPTDPSDVVYIFPPNSSGLNKPPGAAYCYTDGSVEGFDAGWYNTSTFAASDALEIPAGAAVMIRKGAGVNSAVSWNPNTPYSLQ